MTQYQFHWWETGTTHAPAQSVRLEAESHLHGAALALQHFVRMGCDIAAPLAHLDITEPDGSKQTLLVEEVVDWLSDPNQREFIQREGLEVLMH